MAESKKTKSKTGDLKVLFTCQYCEKKKPLEDMRRITRFNPVIIACGDCEKLLR